jgi:hypothetical protein
MTDLRARLAEALRQLDYNEMVYGDKKNYEARADVLLSSLPGIAIVDVTDPDAVNDVVLAVGRYLAAVAVAEQQKGGLHETTTYSSD